MAEPSDQELYNSSKREVDKNYDKPSAYRSMAYTRTYLKNYREKYGDAKKAYKGSNPGELKTWRKEKWVDVKSFLQNPKKTIACGNAPIKAGEYPLCMPESDLTKYNKSELNLLVQRKNQIGKRRLVKDAFLRDVLEPEKITPIREYKDKYVADKKYKLPEPLPKAKAEKILKEKPIKKSEYEVIKEPKPPKEYTFNDRGLIYTGEGARRKIKNQRQKEKYISVRKPREKKEKIPKPPKEPKEKITFPKLAKPFNISMEPTLISWD